jgi:putative oxidoreductase
VHEQTLAAIPRSLRVGRVLLVAGRILLGAMFVYAAYAKLHFDGAWHLRDYHFFFAFNINSYQILPDSAVIPAARLLPLVELLIGVLLIVGWKLHWVAASATALFVVFIAAMTRAAILGLEINCGCFGNNEKLGTLTLIRDYGFMLFAVAVTAGAFLSRREHRPVL